jgi:hypothetical protein
MDGFKTALGVFAASLISNYRANERFRAIVDRAYDEVCKHADEQDEREMLLAPFFAGIAEGFADTWKTYVEEDESTESTRV